MYVSGKTITFARFLDAFWISEIAFCVVDLALRKTGAAWQAATLTSFDIDSTLEVMVCCSVEFSTHDG